MVEGCRCLAQPAMCYGQHSCHQMDSSHPCSKPSGCSSLLWQSLHISGRISSAELNLWKVDTCHHSFEPVYFCQPFSVHANGLARPLCCLQTNASDGDDRKIPHHFLRTSMLHGPNLLITPIFSALVPWSSANRASSQVFIIATTVQNAMLLACLYLLHF